MITVHLTIEDATELLDILKDRENSLINDLAESLTYRLDKAKLDKAKLDKANETK